MDQDVERLGYRPALDGMRAIAIGAVVAFHYERRPFLGGWIGVNLFFVLSGFLITRLLMEEHWAANTIALRAFYRRRAARLLPALYLMLVVALVIGLTSDVLGRRRVVVVGALAAFTYATNIVIALKDFVPVGNLGITWSLALEEQFYAVWPLSFLFLVRRWSRLVVRNVVLGVVAILFLQMALRSGADFRVPMYVGFDGQGMAFLLSGCALALHLDLKRVVSAKASVAAVVGVGVAVFPVVFLVGPYDRVLFRGLLVVLAASMCLIVAMVLLSPDAARVFVSTPLVWIGRRSYAIYLWHIPASALVTLGLRHLDLATNRSRVVPVAVVLTLILSHASFELLEQPFRQRYGTKQRSVRVLQSA